MNNLTFIELGKNASSTLKPSIKKLGINFYHLDHNNPVVRPNADLKVIFCYRDPIDRFISAWRSRYEMGWPNYYPNPWMGIEPDVFNYYNNPEDYIQDILKGKLIFKPIHGHFLPQSSILSSIRTNQIEFVLDFDDIQNSFNKLCNHLGKSPIKLGHEHSAKTKKEEVADRPKCSKDYKHLSDSSISFLKGMYNYDYFLKAKII